MDLVHMLIEGLAVFIRLLGVAETAEQVISHCDVIRRLQFLYEIFFSRVRLSWITALLLYVYVIQLQSREIYIDQLVAQLRDAIPLCYVLEAPGL